MFLQRDQYFAVHGANGRGVGQRGIGRAIGQADIVEHYVDLVVPDDSRMAASTPAKFLCVSSIRVAGAPHVHAHLSRVDLRKEIHPEQWEQQHRDGDQHAEHRTVRPAGPP